MIARRLDSLLSLSWKNEPYSRPVGGNLGLRDPAAVDVPEEVVLRPNRGVEAFVARPRASDLGFGVVRE